MASSLNEEHVEKKLLAVNNTQDSIQGLSLWIIHHKSHHARIVELWAKVLKKTVKPSHRLTLYYLCNDVVQNCKRKKANVFLDTFKPHLKHSTPLVRDVSIKPKIERILNIWEERQVYDKAFVDELRQILDGKRADGVPVKKSHSHKKHSRKEPESTTPPMTPADVFDEMQPPDPTLELEALKEEKEREKAEPEVDVPTPEVLAEFKPQEMAEKIRTYKRQAGEVEVKVRQMTHLKLDASSIEAVKQLKDRAHGNEFSTQFEESCQRLEDAVKCLEKKQEEEKDLIAQLRISEYFYDEQNREAKIVANAYKNFGSRINTMKRRLQELMRSLPSPVPSPTPDAPSPEATPPDGLESNTQPVDMEIDPVDEPAPQAEAFTRPRVALTSTTRSIIKPISSIREITFAEDDIPSPPDEAPSPVSSPESPHREGKGSSSLENRLASFIPSLQAKKSSNQPIPVYVPQPLNSSSNSSSSGRRTSANKTLTESDMPFGEEEGGSTPLTDERPTTPVMDEDPSLAPPPPPPPSSSHSSHDKKKKKENPMDFLSRLILSQTQSKTAGTSSSFLEGFSQLTSKVKEHLESSNSNGSDLSPASPVEAQGPKSWADWKAQAAGKSDDGGDSSPSIPPPPVPNFAMPPPPPPVPPPVLRPDLGMPPPHMPPPMNSPPGPFFQQTSPGQKENWPEVQGGPGEGGDAGPSPTMMYPPVLGDVPPPPFPPPVSKPQLGLVKGCVRKPGGHSVLKELTRSDDTAPVLPPPPPPPMSLQSPISSIPTSVSQSRSLDQPPSSSGMDLHAEAEEFIEKLKRKTLGVGSSSYTPNPARPNLMTLTPGSDGDDGVGEADMDLEEEEGGEEEEEEEEEGDEGNSGPRGPSGIPVLSSVVRRVDPSEKTTRDMDRLEDRDEGIHEHSHDPFHKDRRFDQRSPDFLPSPSGPRPPFDYRDNRFFPYETSRPPYFEEYAPNPRPPLFGGNPPMDFRSPRDFPPREFPRDFPGRDFPGREMPFRPKRPFGNRGGYSRRPNFRY